MTPIAAGPLAVAIAAMTSVFAMSGFSPLEDMGYPPLLGDRQDIVH
jgi:hypothetical protein